jgi:hypothetical protein
MKWVIFPYRGKGIKKIITLLRGIQMRVAFQTSNTTENIAKSNPQINRHGRKKMARIKLVNAPYRSSPLNYICNKSIRNGTFPTRLKHSIVKPLFKKGDRKHG